MTWGNMSPPLSSHPLELEKSEYRVSILSDAMTVLMRASMPERRSSHEQIMREAITYVPKDRRDDILAHNAVFRTTQFV